MRDVGSQLAEYFEATTERVDAEDVLVRAAVNHQVDELPHHRRLRPAWATAAGFAGVLVLVGGALLAGWMLRNPTVVEPQPTGARVAATGGGWGWWPLLAIGGVALVGFIVLVAKRLLRATREVDMQTLDENQQEATAVRTWRGSRRAWLIVMAALVVVAGAIASWAIIEANQDDDGDLAIVNEFADSWDAAVLASDGQSAAALFTEDGAFGDWLGRETIGDAIETWGQYYAEMSHGEPTKVDDGVYVYPVTAIWVGQNWAGEMTITLDEDLVSSAQLDWSQVD
jgi:hypothetical protein